MKRISIITLFAVSLFSLLALPQFQGSIGIQEPLGGKGDGMGGAFCAVADDAVAAFWNPAGIVLSETPWVSGASSGKFVINGKSMMTHQYLTAGLPIGSTAFGLSWANQRMGNDHNLSLVLGSMGIEFSTQTISVVVGANLKFYHQELRENVRTGVGADFGALIKLPMDGSLGLVLQDIGGTPFGEGQTILPAYHVGVSKALDLEKLGVLTAAMSVTFAESPLDLTELRFGANLAPVSQLEFRGGFCVPDLDFSQIEGSFGMGAKVEIPGFGWLVLDAAYSNSTLLGSSYVFSFTLLLDADED